MKPASASDNASGLAPLLARRLTWPAVVADSANGRLHDLRLCWMQL